MMKKLVLAAMAVLLSAVVALAGGWAADKGLDKMTLTGELVCIGCSLKKLDGANAQCNLYAHHAVGFRTADGLLWNIVDNEKGHDVIRAHRLLEKGVKATISGWIYPVAHFIEIDSIKVEGVSMAQIQQSGLEEDHLIAKRLASRKLGEVPTMEHDHGHAH